jgi:hypothetical protein
VEAGIAKRVPSRPLGLSATVCGLTQCECTPTDQPQGATWTSAKLMAKHTLVMCTQPISLWVDQSRRGRFFCPRRKNGAQAKRKKNTTFWVVVTMHYAQNKPTSGLEQAARSLETKLGNLKANIGKFVGYYEHIKGLEQERANIRRHHHHHR